jgi:hypothetical protein
MPDQGPPIWRTGAGAGRSLVLLGTPAGHQPASALRAVRPSEGLSPLKAPPALPTVPVKRHLIRLATRGLLWTTRRRFDPSSSPSASPQKITGLGGSHRC